MLKLFVVLNSVHKLSLGGRLSDGYALLARDGLSAVIAYMRDSGDMSSTVMAYDLEGISDLFSYAAKLNGEDLIISNGDKIYVLLPTTLVAQSRLPF